MRRYVAGTGETLRMIAGLCKVSLTELVSINPLVESPDTKLGGIIVNLPPKTSMSGSSDITFCPPVLPQGRQEQWVPLTPLSQMEQVEYDVLIIGTGAGGSALLWRLCEQLGKISGKRIGVIERGRLLLPTHAVNVRTLWDWNRMLEYFLSPTVSTPIGIRMPEYPGARVVYALGGRTLFWGFTSPRLPPFEFANWPFDYKELEPYYNLAEQMMNVAGIDTPINQLLLRRLWAGGFPESRLLPNAMGDGDNLFSAINFIGDALRLGSFELAVQARAIRILHEEGKVAGVLAISRDRQSYTLKAKKVVVAASTFETPRLLLSSDIPGRAIGHYLTNHTYLSTHSSLPPQHSAEGGISLIIPQTEGRPYQFKLGAGGTSVAFDVSGRVQSRYENFLYLNHNQKDADGVPEIQVNFAYSEADFAVVRQMKRALLQAAEAMKASVPDSDCIWPPGYDFHEAGTCRMGDDSATSATNRYGQIHGISGLYVADNSVLPSTGAVNPTLTTVANAFRTADYIYRTLV
ncbi:GMC family oxidoreductase [Paenibacillus sp. N4]|uniref:GMC oxidoreductase n=1 Tax=Paenibacillus vietnamensis TaxID=2590547 RepID=UPI001CD0599F|nr:GMC family oxidoreductase [Paenibacillus vietnamensis]MCA0754345.1 GMC family oxidoreductase [Paenibacillus vietnamensis]